ncbi:MAG: pyruvate carboxylase subunit B [Euryarchaeota archaeon]|nr:pyruvate carboxylase subunit B [Euryarchaeota archaeon]
MVKLIELAFRDAHQSLLATRMRTEDMLPIAAKMDQVGFWALETWGGATFDVPIRYLNEDPWDRIKTLKAAMPNTPMQMLERAMSIVAYWNFPDDIVKKFIFYAKKNGVDNFRIFDALNDLRNMKVPIDTVNEVGGHAQGCVSYTISPVHTTDIFVNDLLALEKMGCQSVCVKDMAGMIFPKHAYEIIKGYKDAGGKVPLSLHTHSISGMEGITYQRALDAGVDILDGAISPLSGGTAAPPTESIVQALKGTPHDTGYDIKLLMEIRKYFMDVWKKYRHLHRMEAIRPDPSVTVHQIPGGMLSNLVSQLELQGAGHKYQEVLDEVPHVKEELGHPPLVTPTSQVVGVQAVMNVLFGRYKNIPQETKDYVKGMYGRTPVPIKPEIYEKVLGPKWKDEVIDCRPADMLKPLWDQRRKELSEMGLMKKEEDVITYALYPKVAVKFFKGESPPEFMSPQLPLPIDHEYTKAMVKSFLPELKQVFIYGEEPRASGPAAIPTEFKVEVDGEPFEVKVEPVGGYMTATGACAPGAAPKGDVEGAVRSQMQGTILKVKKCVGDKVAVGDVIATIEAMKMEQEIKSEKAGEVKQLFVKEGQAVKPGDALMQVL